MLPEWTVVGFSGHRNIADSKATGDSICAALDALAAKCGPLVAISSLAKGADTLFVEEVAKRKIPFLLVLPFSPVRFRQDFEPEEWQRVAPLLTLASHVEEVSGAESDPEAYMETGVRIVDQADVVIAVWNGESAAGLGGTGDVVVYSRALSKPLQWLNPATGVTVSERLDQLPVPSPTVPQDGSPYQAIEKHFQELDTTASVRAPQFRQLVLRIVTIHLAASATGMISHALHIAGMVGYGIVLLQFTLLGTAFLLTIMQHRQHQEWTKSRIEAEICRSFLATWPMRARITRSPRLSIQGFDPLMRNLRILQLVDGSPAPLLESARDEYLGSRVQNQIDYFGRRSKEAQRAYRNLKGLGTACTGTAAVFSGIHFVLSYLQVKGPSVTITELVSGLLPLVSAALFSLILTQEHSRRASRYGEMASMLEEAAQQLKAVRTWNGLTRIATDTEERLLNEAAEWHSFRRFATH